MSIFSTLIGGASALSGLVQGGYNLYKDINNIDIERQIAAQTAASKDLQQNQFLLNMQEADAGRAFANQQRELSQAYNTAEANKAFARNMMLNSASRNASALRLSGINPIDGASSASGSVGAASTSPVSSPIGSVSAPSFGAGSAHYAPLDVGLFADAEMKNSTTQLQRSQTTNQELRNKTQLLHDLTDIERMRTDSFKLFKDGKLSEAEWQLRKYRYSRIEEITNKELDALEKNANAAVTNATANVTTSEANKQNADTNRINADINQQNADTNEARMRNDAAFQRALIAVQNKSNELKERGIVIEETKLEPVLQSIAQDIEVKKQEAQKKHYEWKLTSREYEMYYDKINAVIDATRAQARNYDASANYTNKQADWYHEKMVKEIYLDTFLDALNVAKPNPKKVGSSTHITYKSGEKFTEQRNYYE